MSTLFGLAHLDGGPVDALDVERMRVRAGRVPGTRAVSHTFGSVALGDSGRPIDDGRHGMLPVRPSAANDGVVVMAVARLDNREELADALDVPTADRAGIGDGDLVQLAYRRWSRACITRLYGDWSLAAWTAGDRRLFLARDQLGHTSMFFAVRSGRVVFASDVEVLFALPAVERRLDELELARYLLITPSDVDRTAFRNVCAVPPGHAASIDANGHTVTRYWHLNRVAPFTRGSDEDYVHEYLAHFRRAVRVRLRTDRLIASTLSSGLDSGAVTALAAEELHERNERLLALTAVPAYPPDGPPGRVFGDEGPLAHSVATRWLNIEHVRLNSLDTSPVLSLMRSLDLHAAPIHAASNVFWLLDVFDHAQRAGAGVLLTGQLGNGGASWSGGTHRLLWLLLASPTRGAKAVREWGRARGRGWGAALVRGVAYPMLRPMWTVGRRFARPWAPAWHEYSAIEPRFARRVGSVRPDRPGSDVTVRWLMSPAAQRQLTLEANGETNAAPMQAFGSAFAFDIRDPTADVRFLEFIAGVPHEQFALRGEDRSLLRRALVGVLPDDVRANTRRARQASDLAARLLADRANVEQMLQTLASDDDVTRYLDVTSLRKTWMQVSANKPVSAGLVGGQLMRGLLAGCFIMRNR